MKDNFSIQAKEYARFRPQYPRILVNYLSQLCTNKHLAWDCGTGNGQIATLLSEFFLQVVGTDISLTQITNAPILPNVTYKVESAEQSTLLNKSVNLVVVAQSIHWFNFDKFYSEVRRVSAPNGIIAAIGYPLINIKHKNLNSLVQYFYTQVVGNYWDWERTHIDNYYRNIPFPFEEISFRKFSMEYTWNKEALLGFLSSWSAVQHYQKQHGVSPISLIEEEVNKAFKAETTFAVTFEIFGRIGKINSPA